MSIFHLDIEAFLTTVERIRQPDLRNRPLVIAPPKDRALILAASPDAKLLGITRDMPLAQVLNQFPGVLVRPPDFALYTRATQEVIGLASCYSPIVEPLAYGHFALEMSGMRQLFRNLEDAAWKLCRELQAQFQLPGTIGIAANKLVSSIAAKQVQKENEPLCQVIQDQEAAFLAPLPCKALPEGNDPAVRKTLFELNLRRIQQIQALPRDLLSFAIGSLGTQLHRHAMGIDPTPVTPPRNLPNLQAEHRFNPDTNDDAVVQAALYRLCETLCFDLRTRNLNTRQARIQLRYTDDIVRERRVTYHPTQTENSIYTTLLTCYERLYDRRQRVRHLRLIYEGLTDLTHQGSLFSRPRESTLAQPLDTIRARFGAQAILSGKSLKHPA